MIYEAKKENVKECVALLRLAMDDVAYHLAGTNDEVLCDEILSNFFKSENNRISYKNIYVFKIDGTIAGAVCVYHGKNLDVLDKEILENPYRKDGSFMLEKECNDDEFYIDSIAVDKNFRSRGIATKLINHIFCIAKAKKFHKVSLIVDENKPKTMRFYENLGFKFIKERLIYNHKYNHLIKDIA